jgi:hypothetical protein
MPFQRFTLTSRHPSSRGHRPLNKSYLGIKTVLFNNKVFQILFKLAAFAQRGGKEAVMRRSALFFGTLAVVAQLTVAQNTNGTYIDGKAVADGKCGWGAKGRPCLPTGGLYAG